MTPTQRAAIDLAISDLEHISAASGRVEFVERRIAALRAALAEPAPVQEHVHIPEMLRETSPERIWLGLFTDDEDANFPSDHEGAFWAESEFADLNVPYIRADLAVAHPAQTKPPLLTDEEVGQLTVFAGLHDIETPVLAEFIRAIERVVRRQFRQTRTAPQAQQPAPVQEPVHKLIYPGGGKALFNRLWHLTCNAVATQSGMRVRTDVLPMREMKEFLDHLCVLVDSPPPPAPVQATSELKELRLAYAECSRQRNELLAKLKQQAQQPRKAVKLTREDHDAIRIKAEQRMSDPNLGWGTALIVETEVAVWAKLGVTE